MSDTVRCRGRVPTRRLRAISGRWLAAGLLLLAATANVHGFGPAGHRVVAAIATGYLTPQAARAVERLLRDDLDTVGQPSGRRSLAHVASWPDEFRLTPLGRPTAPWHFDNIPVCGTAPREAFCPRNDCASGQLDRLLATLRDPDAPYPARNEALKWIVHLVADIHQPLHVADNGDRGGNSVRVSYFGETQWRLGVVNLHTIWDEHLVQGLLAEAGGEAAFVARPVSDTERSAWQTGSLADWIAESHALAVGVVYAKLPGGFACGRALAGTIPIGIEYYEAAAPLLATQLRRAGLRLAKVLNGAL